jgi:hypothetical protein
MQLYLIYIDVVSLIFNVSNHPIFYTYLFSTEFCFRLGAFKYFTGTFEIIFNEEETQRLIRWQ